MITYYFKANQEAIWFVLVAAGTVVVQALATLDIDKITDWRVWAIGLGAAALRAAAGAALSLLNKPQPSTPEPLSDTDIGRLAVAVLDEQARRSQRPPPPPPVPESDINTDVRFP